MKRTTTLLAAAAVAISVAGMARAAGNTGLTKVAGFDHQVTGVSVAPDGRTFVNFPRWTDDAPISVAEVLPGGKLRPYPDAKWNSWRNAKQNEMPVGDYFVCVQSVVADGRGLDGHPSTQVEKDVVVKVDGRPLRRPDGRQPAFSADGIALSNDGATLYWQALTGRTLYSIATNKLTKGVAANDVAAAVQTVGTTTVADGLWMSKAGALYVTSPMDNSVKRWNGKTLETVVSDPRLRWPDTMSEGPDGTIYVTASHIQDTSWFKPGAPASLPTALFSFKPGR
ncbi:MAG: L-dopachrome tautomerase-related protein [Janthinobacterium lividum]